MGTYSKRKKNIITIIQNGEKREDINIDKITYITEEIGYWRKANAIHNYFVVNCGDGEDICQQMWVSKENIKDLLDRCEKVVKASKLVKDKNDGENKIEDSSVAEELLPTAEGFFFGSYEYDEWYLEDIKNTITICKNVLKTIGDSDIYYQASW